jgi:[histone H3]-lysine36 N-dimethyltransferase SETMAR
MTSYEQRLNIKFCQRLGKTPVETFEMLYRVYGQDTSSRATVFRWHRRFKQRRESVNDNDRTGRPATARTDVNIKAVQDTVRKDRRQTVREIAEIVGISYGTCQAILTENLNMQRVCQHIVPKMLTLDQRDERMRICGELIAAADSDDNFIKTIITGDETWCYLYDPQPRRSSTCWKSPSSPRIKKFRRDRSKGKVMLEVFFDWRGIVHYEFIPEGATVNQCLYRQILARLREAVRLK